MVASLFGTQTQINLNSQGTVLTQSFTATEGQQLFTLTLFTYNPDTNSLQVYINGQKQVAGRDFIESSTSTFALVEGATAGDYIDVIGFPLMDLTSSGSSSTGIENSITTYGAIGDNATDNTTAFNTIEGLSSTFFYMPEGTYRTTHLQLTKSYWGPGKIRFNDGYIQKGIDFTEQSPRNVADHITLSAPGDLILNPNGNVTFAGKRIQNVGSPLGDLDGVNLSYVNTNIVPRIKAIETAISATTGAAISYSTGTFTPTIYGGTTAGTGTYTLQQGSWVKIGKLLTIRASVTFTEHTGTGAIKMTFGAFNPASTAIQIGQVMTTFPFGLDYTPNYSSTVFSGLINSGIIEFYRKGSDGQYTSYFSFPATHSGTATAGSANTITLAAGANANSNYYVDRTIRITGGTGAGQERQILFYNGTTKVATTTANWTTTPDATSTYTVLVSGNINTVISVEV